MAGLEIMSIEIVHQLKRQRGGGGVIFNQFFLVVNLQLPLNLMIMLR